MNTHYYFRLYCNLNVSSFFILQGFIYSIGSVDKTDAKVNFEYSFLIFEPVLKKSDIENHLK